MLGSGVRSGERSRVGNPAPEPDGASTSKALQRLARASALLRQRGYLVVEPSLTQAALALTVGPFTLDPTSSTLAYGTQRVALSPFKFLLLQALMEAEGAWCSRRSLRKLLWGDAIPASDPLSVHLHYLRDDLMSIVGTDVVQSSRKRGHRLAFELLDTEGAAPAS